MHSETYIPIGILYRGPSSSGVDAAWWVDSQFRRQGYGYEAVDLLGDLLKKEGVCKIGNIPIRGNFSDASAKLAARLRSRVEGNNNS